MHEEIYIQIDSLYAIEIFKNFVNINRIWLKTMKLNRGCKKIVYRLNYDQIDIQRSEPHTSKHPFVKDSLRTNFLIQIINIKIENYTINRILAYEIDF